MSTNEHELPRVLGVPAQSGKSISNLFEPQRAPVIVKRRVIEGLRQMQSRLEDAEAEAEQLVADATARAAQIRQDAYEEGLARGVSELVDELARARAAYDEMLDDARDDMLELAVGIARRIIGRELDLSPETRVQMIAQSLDLVADRRQITVFVSPDELPTIEAHRELLEARVEAQRIKFEPDPDVTAGGCVIQTEAGRVDARLDVQLQTLLRGLKA